MVPRPLATAIVTVVCLVWVGNFVATVFVPGYDNDPSINFVFATIVGGALALRGDDGAGPIGKIGAALRPHPPPPPPAAPPPAPPPAPTPREEGGHR